MDRMLADAVWGDSAEYKAMVKRHAIAGVGAAVLFLASLLGWVFSADFSQPYNSSTWVSTPWFVVFTIAFLIAYATTAWIMWDRLRRRRMFRLKQDFGLAEELQERERDLADSGEPLSLAALWSVTQERIEYYHRIVTTQSEVSFRNGAITSYVGFGLLLILAITGAVAADNVATSITLGSLGAVGAALAGYLGATFMKVQAQSSAQLRQFFSQPVEFSRLLGAERLIDSLPPEERAASVQLVIQAIMRDSGRSTDPV